MAKRRRPRRPNVPDPALGSDLLGDLLASRVQAKMLRRLEEERQRIERGKQFAAAMEARQDRQFRKGPYSWKEQYLRSVREREFREAQKAKRDIGKIITRHRLYVPDMHKDYGRIARLHEIQKKLGKVCIDRKIKREVMIALKRSGKGTPKKRTDTSDISCEKKK